MDRLMAPRDFFERRLRYSARSIDRARTSSCSTTSSTAPSERASAGVNGLPSRTATKRLLSTDQTRQSLRAAATRCQCEQDFCQADDMLPVCHDAQITGKCQFRADGKCRTVECRNEDGPACIHLQEGGMEAVELQKCLEPGHPRERSDNRHS